MRRGAKIANVLPGGLVLRSVTSERFLATGRTCGFGGDAKGVLSSNFSSGGQFVPQYIPLEWRLYHFFKKKSFLFFYFQQWRPFGSECGANSII